MDPQDLRTLKILEEIEKDHSPRQRELAQKLNISLGLVNSFIKRMIQKGYFKVTMIPKNRIKYILTPHGFAEKTRLTYEYFKFSYHFYKDARLKLSGIFKDFTEKGVTRIVFYGLSDLSEIAYLSLMETNIEMVAIVDNKRVGERFFHTAVKDPVTLQLLSFDKILITVDGKTEDILHKINELNINQDKIETLVN
jgi:DNA-binding MarR family transcriptional regulator